MVAAALRHERMARTGVCLPFTHRALAPAMQAGCAAGSRDGDAGWSSPVARQAHNLKVVGSNPTPATIYVGLPVDPVRSLSPANSGLWPIG